MQTLTSVLLGIIHVILRRSLKQFDPELGLIYKLKDLFKKKD